MTIMNGPQPERKELEAHLENIEAARKSCPINSFGLNHCYERILIQLRELEAATVAS